MATLVWQYFEKTPDYTEELSEQVRDKKKRAGDRYLLCKSCRHRITTESDRIIINQSHEHTRQNPAGLVFTFGCFRDAPGCRPTGPASLEYTWFAGHTWQIVICANCGVHLGWRFRNGGSFFALIVDQLVKE